MVNKCDITTYSACHVVFRDNFCLLSHTFAQIQVQTLWSEVINVFFCGKYPFSLAAIMSYKLQCFSLKAVSPRVNGLLSFNYNNLKEIAFVGHRSFGVIRLQMFATEQVKSDSLDLKQTVKP